MAGESSSNIRIVYTQQFTEISRPADAAWHGDRISVNLRVLRCYRCECVEGLKNAPVR